MIRFFPFSIFMYEDFSVPTERAAITAGDDLRGLEKCHQQAFWQEYRKRIPAKIRNLTEDCIACHLAQPLKHRLYCDGTLLICQKMCYSSMYNKHISEVMKNT